jgi:predicted double-glycine peptidase
MREDTKYMSNILETYGYVNELSDKLIFKIVMEDGTMKEFKKSTNDFVKEAESLGFKSNGVNNNHRQREELQGKPKFSDLNGPMYDGNKSGVVVIRYEQSRK